MTAPVRLKTNHHSISEETPMSRETTKQARGGRVNWTVLLWAIGVPLPIVLIVALMRGCS